MKRLPPAAARSVSVLILLCAPLLAACLPDVDDVKISASRQFAIMTDQGQNTISAFWLTLDGTLALTSSLAIPGANPVDVVATPDGRHIYTANVTANTIGVFALDGKTGALAALSGLTTPVADTPFHLAMHPSGGFLAVSSTTLSAVHIFSIAGNGALLEVGGSPFAANGVASELAFNPAGTVLAYTDPGGQLIETQVFDTGTAALSSPKAATTSGTSPVGTIFNRGGDAAYMASNGQDIERFAIDPSGQPTSPGVSAASLGGLPTLAYHPAQDVIYAVFNGTVEAYQDLGGTFISTGPVFTINPSLPVVDPAGTFLVCVDVSLPGLHVFPLSGNGALGTPKDVVSGASPSRVKVVRPAP